jgi:hypothetical protein
MNEGTTFVGMDAHKASINVALLRPGEQRPVEWKGREQREGGGTVGEAAEARVRRRRGRVLRGGPDGVRAHAAALGARSALQGDRAVAHPEATGRPREDRSP